MSCPMSVRTLLEGWCDAVPDVVINGNGARIWGSQLVVTDDGIIDREDKCPDDPEDEDGFEDEDGCPDADNDGDEIADTDDKCPVEPETKNNYKDDDGCCGGHEDGTNTSTHAFDNRLRCFHSLLAHIIECLVNN